MTISSTWRKASRSNPSGNCVEVRRNTDQIQVRDTKAAGNGPVLSFTLQEWSAFVDGVKVGEFEI